LEKLNRYETHLDRKFERTLAMLLKLKQLARRMKMDTITTGAILGGARHCGKQ
jgi:hypothetical protein